MLSRCRVVALRLHGVSGSGFVCFGLRAKGVQGLRVVNGEDVADSARQCKSADSFFSCESVLPVRRLETGSSRRDPSPFLSPSLPLPLSLSPSLPLSSPPLSLLSLSLSPAPSLPRSLARHLSPIPVCEKRASTRSPWLQEGGILVKGTTGFRPRGTPSFAVFDPGPRCSGFQGVLQETGCCH